MKKKEVKNAVVYAVVEPFIQPQFQIQSKIQHHSNPQSFFNSVNVAFPKLGLKDEDNAAAATQVMSLSN